MYFNCPELLFSFLKGMTGPKYFIRPLISAIANLGNPVINLCSKKSVWPRKEISNQEFTWYNQPLTEVVERWTVFVQSNGIFLTCSTTFSPSTKELHDPRKSIPLLRFSWQTWPMLGDSINLPGSGSSKTWASWTVVTTTVSGPTAWFRCYKTFYSRNLQTFLTN